NFLWIIRQLAIDLGVDRQDRTISHHECMAVRRRADEGINRNAAVRSRPVLHNDRLTQSFLQPTATNARYRVWQSSSWVCNYEFNWLPGRLRLCGRLRQSADC